MIEEYSHKYDYLFDEPNSLTRWERLKAIYTEDYGSFRVLFLVEALALIDKWREPTPTELNTILHRQLSGGRVAVRIGDVTDLFQPVWPLEIAKYEYQVYLATCDSSFRRQYFMTSIRSFAASLVQTWWAIETLMNDFAGIIAEQRRDTLDQATLDLLEEKRTTVDKKGDVVVKRYYQPILQRIQIIYGLLTGEELDHSSSEWRHLVELKNTRDAFMHRVGKDTGYSGVISDDTTLVNGMSAVREVLGQVMTKTPEFAAKFVYSFLSFWSCGSESPFFWDGAEGDTFYLGFASVKKETVAALFAPRPGSFSAERISNPSETKDTEPGAGNQGTPESS